MKNKLVEICASYSRKLNTGNFQSRDVFCSHKEECEPEEAEATYKRIFHFCKTVVDNEIDELIKELAEPVIDINEAYYPKPVINKPKTTFRPMSENMIERKAEQTLDHGQDNITEEWVEDQKLRNK